MARFYATVRNGRGTETSVGGQSSVDEAHVRGWHVGIRVRTVKLTDGDRLDVYMTGGSNGSGGEVLIGHAVFQTDDEAPRFVVNAPGDNAEMTAESAAGTGMEGIVGTPLNFPGHRPAP